MNALWHLQVGLRAPFLIGASVLEDTARTWGQFARWVASRGKYEPWSEVPYGKGTAESPCDDCWEVPSRHCCMTDE
jgi:hypothetical protein